ncbi:MAG TPA: sulfotransferase [Mycobacteriales bacterium]|nr:sulfotransferase [Mycobacteriales bacterium]
MTAFAMVLGTGRCGSTLVHEILAQHADVGFVSNVDDRLGVRTRRSHVRAYRRLPPSITRKGRIRFAPSEAYRVLGREVSPLLADSDRDLVHADATPWLGGRLADFFQGRAEAQRFPHFLHKFTGWPRSGLIDAVLPETRFVTVVRDGRAVANSWLQMPWWRGNLGPSGWHFGPLPAPLEQVWEESDRSPVVLAGLGWALLSEAYDRAAAQIPAERWCSVRYEDLLADPAATFRLLLEHLRLPWTAQFARRLDTYSFETGRLAAYRQDLGPAATESLEAAIAPALARHGYR